MKPGGWPPFRGAGTDDATGTVYLSANRNKRSIAVDLRSPQGLAVVHRLAQQADVVIASFGPGVAEKLKVDAVTLRALNDRLVYCNISGFGSVGSMRNGKGYDVILQAFYGMLSITGERDGPPVRSPFSPVDQATGLHALVGVLAALLERSRTGKGALVEASLFDSATGFLGYFLQAFWKRGITKTTGRSPNPGVGGADDGRLSDLGHLGERNLERLRVDVHAAGDDHVVEAVGGIGVV